MANLVALRISVNKLKFVDYPLLLPKSRFSSWKCETSAVKLLYDARNVSNASYKLLRSMKLPLRCVVQCMDFPTNHIVFVIELFS